MYPKGTRNQAYQELAAAKGLAELAYTKDVNVPTKGMSPLDESMGRLADSSERLSKIIEVLARRLEPVMVPEGAVVKAGINDNTPPTNSPLVVTINHYADITNVRCEWLETLLARLELP